MPDREQMVKRQKVLADFGKFALRNEALDEILTEACRLVGEALGKDFAQAVTAACRKQTADNCSS